jgi:hypothetical protein
MECHLDRVFHSLYDVASVSTFSYLLVLCFGPVAVLAE